MEAVRRAREEEYDLILLDVQMPQMGGFEAATSLRREPDGHARPRLRVVGISAEDQEPGSCEAAGMDDFLRKPIRLSALTRAIQDCSPATH